MSRIYLIKLGETIPGEPGRLRRMTGIASRLARDGHEIVWITSDFNHQKKSRRSPDLAASSVYHNFELVMLKAPAYPHNLSLWRLAHHLIFAWRLINWLNKNDRPDLIWCCFPTVPVSYAVSKWANSRDVKFILDIQDLVPDVFFKYIPAVVRDIGIHMFVPVRILVRRSLSRSDAVVGVSSGYLKWGLDQMKNRGEVLSASLPLGYERVTHDCTRLSVPAKEILAELRTTSSIKVIYSGVFGSSYDLGTLIRAAEIAAEQSLDCHFVVVGDGDQQKKIIDAAARLGNFTYVGWLKQGELAAFLEGVDVGVMPYVHGATQGLPNKIFEYLAYGLPVISSLEGECSEFIKRYGIGKTYRAGSAESLIDVIEGMVRETKALKMTQKKCRSLFESEYQAEFILERVSCLVRQTLAQVKR